MGVFGNGILDNDKALDVLDTFGAYVDTAATYEILNDFIENGVVYTKDVGLDKTKEQIVNVLREYRINGVEEAFVLILLFKAFNVDYSFLKFTSSEKEIYCYMLEEANSYKDKESRLFELKKVCKHFIDVECIKEMCQELFNDGGYISYPPRS